MHFFRVPSVVFPSSSVLPAFLPSCVPNTTLEVPSRRPSVRPSVRLPPARPPSRMVDSLGALPPSPALLFSLSSLSRHLPPFPACLCVRCARTSKISICSFIQSRSGGGGGATCVHFSPPPLPPLFLYRLSLPFPAGESESDSFLFFFAGSGGRVISLCTQPQPRTFLYGTLPWQTHRR